METEPKVLVVIPAYNEKENIGKVIDGIKKSVPSFDIVVIDDGSTDTTVQVAKSAGAEVISHSFNLGIGGAVQTGYKFAKEMGYTIIVRIDGDGQHNASEIPALLKNIVDESADFVIGSRFLAAESFRTSFARHLGISFFSSLISWILHQRITDSTSGFHAANLKVMEFCAREFPFDYPEVESLVFLHRAGFRIQEIPVHMEKRAGGKSSITPMQSLYYMAKVFLSILITLLRKAPEEQCKISN